MALRLLLSEECPSLPNKEKDKRKDESYLSLASSLKDMQCMLPLLSLAQRSQHSVQARSLRLHACSAHHAPASVGLLKLPCPGTA